MSYRAVAILLAASFTFDVALAGDPEAGADQFRKCSICHMVGPGAYTKLGPELNGLNGRRAGGLTGFKYTDPLRNSRFIWSLGSFKLFIKGPRDYIPGILCMFSGMPNETQQEDLWAYLSLFGPDGKMRE